MFNKVNTLLALAAVLAIPFGSPEATAKTKPARRGGDHKGRGLSIMSSRTADRARIQTLQRK